MSDPSQTPDSRIQAFRTKAQIMLEKWRSNQISFEDAREQLDDMLQEAIEANLPANQVVVHNLYGIMHYSRSELDAALNAFQTSRQLAESIDYKAGMLSSDQNIGDIERLKGNFSRALVHFQRAVRLAEELDHQPVQAAALFNLAQVWQSLDKNADAARYMNDAMAIMRQPWEEPEPAHVYNERMRHQCEAYHVLADIHLKDRDYERAFESASRAVSIANELQQSAYLGYANRAMGNVTTEMENASRSTHSADPDIYYQAAVEAFEEAGLEGEIARTHIARGRSLQRRGQRQQAITLFQKASRIFNELGMNEEASRADLAKFDSY